MAHDASGSGATRVVALPPGVNQAAYTLHMQAVDFAQAAELIRHNPSSAARLILQVFAIEFALKAWLLDHGKSEREVYNLKHDLPTAVSTAKGLGLALSDPDTEHLIARLDACNKNAALRYDFQYFDVPLPTDISRVLAAVLRDTAIPLPPLRQAGGPQ